MLLLGFMGDAPLEGDENQEPRTSQRVLDAEALRQPVSVLPRRKPLLFSPFQPVSEAMVRMRAEERGAVLASEDGTPSSRLVGIFTDRDVLLKVVGGGRNPAALPLGEVMTRDPESLSVDDTIARVLNMMALSGNRHVPVVDPARQPLFVLSVRDVVQYLVDLFPHEVLTLSPHEPRFRDREGA